MVLEPLAPCGEVDDEAGRVPCGDPEVGERGEIRFAIGAKPGGAHLSVSLSSMRRLRAIASSSAPWSMGWNSPNPAAASRSGSTPFAIKYCTTETARAADSSQF